MMTKLWRPTDAILVAVMFGLSPTCFARGDGREGVLQDAHTSNEDGKADDHADASELIGPVIKLNDVIFSGNVLRKETYPVGHWIVYYCPSWWEPCQDMYRFYEQIAQEAQTRFDADSLLGLSMRFAQVDCASHKVLCNKMNVEGYPTVHRYSEGTLEASWQGRKSESLRKWIEKQFGFVQTSKQQEPTLSGNLSWLASEYLTLGPHVPDLLVAVFVVMLNFWIVSRNTDLWHKASGLVDCDAGAGGVPTTDSTSEAIGQPETPQRTGMDLLLPEEWLSQRAAVSMEMEL